jgi:TolA-binding protein
MTRRFGDFSRIPLRDQGTTARVDAIWRKLERGVGGERVPVAAARLLVPATLVLVFGSGVFVGARFLGSGTPEAPAVLSAERPVAAEPAGGRLLPGARPEEQPKPEPSVRHAQRRPALAVAAPRLDLITEEEPLPPVLMAPPLAPAAPPTWERFAEAGDFEAARAALDAEDGFDGAVALASASQLMTLVDIARASGSKERALLALRRLVVVFPGAPEAPDAAWTLGNMLAQAGDQAGAAEAFSLYRRLSPAGDFAQDALAHEVDAAFARGDLELSARLVAQYENEFPNGPRLDEFRAELERRTAKSVKPAAEAEPEPPAEDDATSVDPAVSPVVDPATGKQPAK